MHGHLGVIFTLLVLYQVKHFLADYPLQTPWMLGKFKDGWAFLGPLAAHAGVHAVCTLIIALCFNPRYFWLAGVDFILHFLMDRIKARPNYMGRWKALSGYEYMSAIKRQKDLELLAFQNILYDIRNADTMEIERQYHEVEVENKKKFRDNMYFWWALGFDQMFHHLTHYFIIWMIIKGSF